MFSSFRAIRGAVSNVTIRGLKMVRTAKAKGTLEDVKASSGQQVHDIVVGALEDRETIDPQIKAYEFRGTDFHMSHKDLTDPNPVLSVRLFSDIQGGSQNYLETLHIHEDGSVKSNNPKEK